MFVCFSNFYLRHNFMEIREGDFLIRKVCKKIPFLVKTHKQSSPVETFSEALPLPPTLQKVRLLGPSVPVWEE